MKRSIYILARLFFYGFSLFAALLTLFSIFGTLEYFDMMDFSFISFKESDAVNFAILKIQLGISIEILFGSILPLILGTLYFYCYYFYALKDFFKLFTNEKVFDELVIKKLNLFHKLNYFPALVFLGRAIYSLNDQNPIDGELLIISIIHFVIGILLLYYLDLVKKGVKLQQENDLTI